ncbi:MAG: hypothetical protein Kow0047_12050 [Anaerolineae bacterium]
MAASPRILLIEDDSADAELLLRRVRQVFPESVCERVTSKAELMEALSRPWDLLLADYHLPDLTALEVLNLLKQRSEDIPVIVVSGNLSEEIAVQCMREGAADYLLKDRLARLPSAIQRALSERALREEKRRAEDALRQSEAKFAIAFRTSLDAVNINRLSDGLYIQVNEGFTALTGYTEEDVRGKTSSDIQIWANPADRERLVAALRAYGEVRNLEAPFRMKDGSIRIGLMSARVIEIDGEMCILSVTRDITDRKRMQDAEREQRLLAEALRDTAQILNSTLELEEVLDRILGCVRQVIPHDAANIMLLDDDVARVVRAQGYAPHETQHLLSMTFPLARYPNLSAMATSGAPYVVADTTRDPDWVALPIGQWVRSYIGAPISRLGRVIGFLNLDSRLERFYGARHAERLQLFADQVAIALHNARLYAEMREAVKARDEMIQNVSHELRTPLTLIMGYLELLADGMAGPLTSEQHNMINTIQRQSTRLLRMIERLLTLQTITTRNLEMVEISVAGWLRDLQRMWRRAIEDAGLKLEITPPQPDAIIRADPDLLSEAMANIIDNAIKFSRNGGTLRLWGEVSETEAIIAVADQGIGIPEEELTRIFDRFYQVEGGSTRRFGGMGIGLSLTQAIIVAHHGRVWATSQGLGRGSTFYVALPLIRREPQ